MGSYDDTYSRFIFLAKVLLPLAALILLSTIFLVSRNVDPTASIPYAKVDVEQLLRDQGVSAPTYSSLARDGTAITFQATRVLPESGDGAEALAEEITLQMDYTSGVQVQVVSDLATLDSPNEQALLKGGVEITTSDGYTMTTDALIANMEGAWLRSDTEVQLTGPVGTLTAGKMEMRKDETDPGHHVVDFQGGVKMLYTPQPKGDAR